MSKTKAELQDENDGLANQVDELEKYVAKLENQAESGDGAEIPEHGHSRHESRQERQNRLRSRHMRKELATLTDAA